MQVTTLSFFRFSGIWPRVWAFVNMELSKRPLRRTPDAGFAKVLGTGRGQGFDPVPNLSVYCLMATWPSLDVARERVTAAPVYRRYHEMSDEHWSVFLQTTRSRGSWEQHDPFIPSLPELGSRTPSPPGTIAIVTRASVRASKLVPFWRSVPAVSDATENRPGLRFKIGMGELPVVELMTFSLWDELTEAQQFAYHQGAHRASLQRSRDEGWFHEELFARFRLLDAQGCWEGKDPLARPVRAELPALAHSG